MDTGALKWHFQYTPGDDMDYDEVGSQMLVDTQIDGQDRKVLAHFGRNGLFYTLDRTNGSYIASGQYVKQLTWTKGLDPKTGLPMEYDPTSSLQTCAMGAPTRAGATATTCPNYQGGVNFFPAAYNPVTGMAYGAGIEGCTELSIATIAPEDVVAGQIFQAGAGVASGVQAGSITMVDVKSSKQVAKHDTPYPFYSGVLLTPDLVWAGSPDGTFAANDATTLEEKWSLNVGSAFAAPPITYTANGKQYIAIAGGGIGLAAFGQPELQMKQAANMLWVFALE